jgi:hypothetical protein
MLMPTDKAPPQAEPQDDLDHSINVILWLAIGFAFGVFCASLPFTLPVLMGLYTVGAA